MRVTLLGSVSNGLRTNLGLLRASSLHGSVSYGTFDLAVLIPLLLDLLRNSQQSRHRHEAVVLIADTRALVEAGDYSGEAAIEVFTDLVAMLNESAPPGYYFGSLNPGDSDFGYWLIGA